MNETLSVHQLIQALMQEAEELQKTRDKLKAAADEHQELGHQLDQIRRARDKLQEAQTHLDMAAPFPKKGGQPAPAGGPAPSTSNKPPGSMNSAQYLAESQDFERVVHPTEPLVEVVDDEPKSSSPVKDRGKKK